MKKVFCLLACMASIPAVGQTLVLPPADVDLVGEMNKTVAIKGDSLLDIARRNGLGQEEIVLANPGVDRWLPDPGASVVLPLRYILPNVPRKGIVLNLPEMRVYYYRDSEENSVTKSSLITHPVSVGRMDWDTPLGTTKIVQKKKDPTWTPPESIRKEHELDGDPLPKVVPAGPDNPLGQYAMRLGIPGYLIHGTNKPFGVGMRVTHGCVRMYPEDIEAFFNQVPLHTDVTLVNEPVKVGWYGNQLYIEIHPPMEESKIDDEALLQIAADAVREKVAEDSLIPVRWSLLRQAVREKSGIPQLITREEEVY